MNEWTVEGLKAFEEKIADFFNKGEIRAPIHLSDGNESSLIEIFKVVFLFRLYPVVHREIVDQLVFRTCKQ